MNLFELKREGAELSVSLTPTKRKRQLAPCRAPIFQDYLIHQSDVSGALALHQTHNAKNKLPTLALIEPSREELSVYLELCQRL